MHWQAGFDTQLHMYRCSCILPTSLVVVFFHLTFYFVGTFKKCSTFDKSEAYSHAKTGLSLVFPSWLVHGVAPHYGARDRVVFAYNLHTVPGTTLSSWAKTTL